MVGTIGAEGSVALLINQPRRRVRKAGSGILVGWDPLRLEEQGPSRAEALEHIVEPGGDRDELGLSCAIKVGTTVAQRALERAILVEHDTGSDQARPRQVIAERRGLLSVFGQAQHASAPLWRARRDKTVRKAGSLRVTHTATA